MKLSVRVRGEWLAVPCKGDELVRWLGEEAMRRYRRANDVGTSALIAHHPVGGTMYTDCHDVNNNNGGGDEEHQRDVGLLKNGETEDRMISVRRASGGSILDFDDQVASVLDDNDFVLVGK